MTLDSFPAPAFQSKVELYAWLVQQTEALVEGMSRRFTPQANLVIGLGNVASLCFYELNRFCNPGAGLEDLKVNWLGFYLFQAPGLLGLGPFQGRPACTEIRVGKGVCGTVAESGESLVVRDVHDFPGHIACDSASKSEVVVPVLIENGSVVAVIDVDSTEVGFFTEEDRAGLERIAAVLVQHLEFPMARALAVNPSLGLPGYSALAGGERAFQQSADPSRDQASAETPANTAVEPSHPTTTVMTTATATTTTTTVTHIPFFKVEARQPDITMKTVSGWQFTRSKLDRIMTQEEVQDLQDTLDIAALPEIGFRNNSLSVGPEADRQHPWLYFSVDRLLRCAAQYYRSDEFREMVEPQLRLSVPTDADVFQFHKFDPRVDWAWRNNFCGIVPGQTRLVPRPTGMAEAPGINWDLLKDTSLPILFYGDFDMMEDDLHDHGMVTSNVKYRVMDTAFFILFRHLVRLNNGEAWMREVRIFHEFGRTRPPASVPHVVFLEQHRHLRIAEQEETVNWKDASADALSAQAEVLYTREWMLEKDMPE